MSTHFSILLILFSVLCSCNKPDFTDSPIVTSYASSGNLEITVHEILDTQSDSLYRIYLHEGLIAPTPVIIWGNGTGSQPEDYDKLMRHLASWGFIVLNTYSPTTGTGRELSEALAYLWNEHQDSNSFFYQKIDTTNIGTAGHSQGSTGSINAHTNFVNGKHIKTVVSIALPALYWANEKDKYDISKITSSFLILGGGSDYIITPTVLNEKAIDNTKDITAAMLILKKSGHLEILDDGQRFRGLLTAWFRFQLAQDISAADVYVGDNAEILSSKAIRSIIRKNL